MSQLLKNAAVILACHILTPLAFAGASFGILAIMTDDVSWAIAGGVTGLVLAWLTARQYTLIAVGPYFADRDVPATWSFVMMRIVRLFLTIMLTPAVVLAVYFGTARSTPWFVLAFVAGIPTHCVVCLLLRLNAQTWSWRVRRGRVIQSAEQILAKIAVCVDTAKSPLDYVPWAGAMVPSELFAPHTKILGMTGSGKTITIRIDLAHCVQRCSVGGNVKVVVFDPKRELYNYILGMNPQVPVLLFDATDERGVAWDVAADITEPNHAKTAAKLMVPDEHSTQPYFARAARRILEWVIRYLILHSARWNLQDVLMILDDLDLLRRILPRRIVEKYFEPESTLKNTLSTLDTLTSRYETVAACWARAEKEGKTISLKEFEASPNSAILVIPRRLDIADAIDPTIRLIFERLIHMWLARPDSRFLTPDRRSETHLIMDEVAKAGNLARIDDLLLMGRAKGVSVTIAAQDVEAMRQEYGEKVADSLLAQCGNTAVFALESPETREYCASLFGTYETRERPNTSKATDMSAALTMDPKDLYHPGELREQKTLLSSEFSQLPRPVDTGRITGYFITAGLGAHYASYPFAHLLLPASPDPVLIPRSAADQELPAKLTPADLRRLGIPGADDPPANLVSATPKPTPPPRTDSLRFVKRMNGE